VIDGETGYIVNPLDTVMFAERLIILLGDANLRERMGQAGRERFLAQFTLERHLDHVIRLYRSTAHS